MKGQILVIDDNPIDVKVASTAIERSGFACFGFTEHENALGWLAENTPQAIFLDIQLKDLTGFDVIPMLKKQPALKSIPIIIISGKNQSEDVRKAIQLGAIDYIVKPLDPLIIQEKLEKLSAKESTQEFHSVAVGGSAGLSAFLSKPVQIQFLSEFGLKCVSETKIVPGETVELTSLPTDLFGRDHFLLRCLSCEPLSNSTAYIVQMTFVGMTEGQRQFLRKTCRQIWIQSKGEAV